MKKGVPKKLLLIQNTIGFLDILLALLIIAGSFKIVNTNFGKASLSFGFLMLWITVFLRIKHRL